MRLTQLRRREIETEAKDRTCRLSYLTQPSHPAKDPFVRLEISLIKEACHEYASMKRVYCLLGTKKK